MRYLPTSKLVPGMALGQDLYDGSGRLLLAKHLLLNAEYISNLEFLGFPGIYIDDEFTRGIEIQEILSPQVRCQALGLIHDLFHFEADDRDLPVSEIKLQMIVENVVDDILKNGDVMCNMMDIREYDNYIYYHSVNVGALAVMIGARYGLKREELYGLTTAAMLHDLGKKFLSPEILHGNWPLQGEERELWKKHPKLGCEFLRSAYHFPSKVHTAILMHHEWYNGDGYPMGCEGESIPLYARIIKLADCYDAMVSKRPGRKTMPPSDAIEYLMAMGGVEFDPEIVEIFIKKIAVYPVGCEVELSNGLHAVVAKNFQDFALRPQVKVVETGEMLNLRDDPAGRSITIGRTLL